MYIRLCTNINHFKGSVHRYFANTHYTAKYAQHSTNVSTQFHSLVPRKVGNVFISYIFSNSLYAMPPYANYLCMRWCTGERCAVFKYSTSPKKLVLVLD